MVNKTTGERIVKIETDIKYIKEKLDDFITTADEKYASKITEKIVYGLVGMVLIAFVSKLTGLW